MSCYASAHGRLTSKTAGPYIPPGFDRPPQVPSEAIAAAAAVIDEEGRWGRNEWFDHHDEQHPDYEQNPYCNGWTVCAEGALQIVTIGAVWIPGSDDGSGAWDAPSPYYCSIEGEPSPERELFNNARSYVQKAIGIRYGYGDSHIPRFNDQRGITRDHVLEVFADAELYARADEDKRAQRHTEGPK